nr:hypothetical protein [Lachnoclostridium phytofermentans]
MLPYVVAGAWITLNKEKDVEIETGQISRNKTTIHKKYENFFGAFFNNSLASKTKTITTLAVRLMSTILGNNV